MTDKKSANDARHRDLESLSDADRITRAEVALRAVMNGRVELAKSQAKLVVAGTEVTNAWAKLATAEAELAEIAGLVPSTGRQHKGLKLPTGKNSYGLRNNIHGLRHVAQSGKIDHAALVMIVYGDDTRENRKRSYARVSHWKSKGLIIAKDGGWVVQPGLLEKMEHTSSQPPEQ